TENLVRDLPANGRDFANLIPSVRGPQEQARQQDQLSIGQLQQGQQGQQGFNRVQQGQQRQQGQSAAEYSRAAAAEGTIGGLGGGQGGAAPPASRPGAIAGVLGGVLTMQPPAAAPPPPPPPAAVMPSAVVDRIAPLPRPNINGYDQITDNPFIAVSQEPLTT